MSTPASGSRMALPTGARSCSGTGLDVWELLATVRQPGGSVDAASRYVEPPASAVRAAVRYYAAFPAEIDDLLERQAAIAEREQAAAKRERAISR